MAATLRAFQRAFGHSGEQGQVIELPGVTACVCPWLGFRSLFNAAAYESPEALAAALPELADAYRDAGVTAWGVWAHESDGKANGMLAQAGLAIDSRPLAMALELSALEPSREHSGVAVERTRDLGAFDAVLAAAYDFPPTALAAVMTEGDCGITLVGTVPEARGRGMATALTMAALRDAVAAACMTSTLQATTMGAPVYESLGYRGLGEMRLWERRVETG